MKNIFLSILFSCTISAVSAQGVGIGTDTPSQTLDVVGNVKVNENLYLENPGAFSGNSVDSYLMVRDNSDNTLKRYVPATAQYGAINSTVYYIKNVNANGLTSFDTGISATEYYLVIGGFIIRGVNDDSNISITQPTNTEQYIPQYSARSFIQNGTWHIKFVPNNGRIFNQNPELRLSVSVYKRNMLTTVNNVINVNMNAVTSGVGSAPPPVMP